MTAENSTGRGTGIKQVMYQVVPLGGGMANVDYSDDGKITGGHLSGDNPPFVHIDNGQLPGDKLKELWAAAGKVLLALGEKKKIDHANGAYRGVSRLTISGDGVVLLEITWKAGEKCPERDAAGLLELVMKHRIGGW